ncbi:MAG: hypothetical protein O9322_05625 [Beijerinckiaceae bacterium]|nr:hypothetical protein [Beijerinckiaceae bacterium]
MFLLWIGLIAMPVRLPEAVANPDATPVVPNANLSAAPNANISKVPTRSLFRPVPPPPSPVAQPVFVPVKPMPPPPPPEKVLRLVGLVDHAEGKVAFIEVQGARDIQRRLAGEAVEGWVVTDIGRREITLRRGDESRTLPLDPSAVR